MSKSLPILIDTANAQRKTTTTTIRTLPSKAKTPKPSDANNDGNDQKNPETQRPSSFIQPHSNHAHTENEQMTTTIRIQSTPSESSDNNHLSYDATEHHHHSTKYNQHEYNNKNNNNNNRRHQITTKPLYDAQQMSLHDERNRATDTQIHEPNGGKVNDVNLMHGIISSSPRDAAKITSSLPSAAAIPKIRHTDIQTMLSVFCMTMVVVCLVICTIVSLRHRSRKSNKHCDKSNLISSNSSVSCSSTTSIDDCEMDFNSSTLCITQTTAIHV